MEDSAYLIGVSLGLIFAAIIGIVFLVIKVSGNKQVSDTWAKRNEKRREYIQRFNREWNEFGLHSDRTVAIKAYHHTAELQELFNLRVDYNKKMIGLCSFETEPYQSFFIKFQDIASIEILNGTQNSTSQSFTSGGAIGGGYGAVGAASTDTYVTNTVSNLRLKIETTDPYAPGKVVTLFLYQVDTSSEVHRMLLNSVEDIKSILNKIVLANKEQQ